MRINRCLVSGCVVESVQRGLVLERFIACGTVVRLAGEGNGTLCSLVESGGCELFHDWATMLDSFGMFDGLAVLVEGKLSRSIVTTWLAAEPSSVLGLLAYASSDLVHTAWIVGGPSLVLVKTLLLECGLVFIPLPLAVAPSLRTDSRFASSSGEDEFCFAEINVGSDLFSDGEVAAKRIPVDVCSVPEIEVINAQLVDDGLSAGVEMDGQHSFKNKNGALGGALGSAGGRSIQYSRPNEDTT